MEIIETSKKKPCALYEGHRYIINRVNKENIISWRCSNYKKLKCKGGLTSRNQTILTEVKHSCVPDIAANEVQKQLSNAKKRAREENVPISTIYTEEVGPLFNRGYELVTEMPSQLVSKITLHRIRRQSQGIQKEPGRSEDINLPPELVKMNDGSDFLLADDSTVGQERILIFSSSKGITALSKKTSFFMDGTFRSSSKQYAQLYTIHVDLGSSLEETNSIPAVYALLPDKKQETYIRLFKILKDKIPDWNPERVVLDFEVAVIQALNFLFPLVKIIGCNYHFNQCIWRKVQDIGMVTDYTHDYEVRLNVRMCSALAHLPLDQVDEGWLLIQENTPNHEKLSKFYDYFVEQWLENSIIPKDMWNCYGERHRTNNAVEGWNHRLNKMTNKSHPNIYALIKTLKDDAEYQGFVFDRMELNLEGNKRKKKTIKIDERIANTLDNFNETGDLKKCLQILAYIQKLE